jgi:phage terminase large subunit-like protein
MRLDPYQFVLGCFRDNFGRPLLDAGLHRDLHDFLSANRYAVVELPRDHGKTTQVCGRIVWELARTPGLRVAVVCATEALAKARCLYLRNAIAGNPRVHTVFPELVPGGVWTQTAFTVERPAETVGPSVAAFGIDAATTGSRCDLLVCDDVVAHNSLFSKADRDRATSSFQNNLLNLLEPGGRCWCLCTPWHPEDLNARLKANPAFALFRRAVGENLEPVWPQKWPPAALALRRTAVGETAFARGYRLVPVAAEDAVIEMKDQQTWTDLPAEFDEVVLAVDPAVTASPDADASGLVVLGRAGTEVYCLEAVAARVRLPDLMNLMEAADLRWRPGRIVFESNAAFKGVADMLDREPRFAHRIESVSHSKSKTARVAVLGRHVRAGCFKLQGRPGGGADPGQQDLWDEMTAFPPRVERRPRGRRRDGDRVAVAAFAGAADSRFLTCLNPNPVDRVVCE